MCTVQVHVAVHRNRVHILGTIYKLESGQCYNRSLISTHISISTYLLCYTLSLVYLSIPMALGPRSICILVLKARSTTFYRSVSPGSSAFHYQPHYTGGILDILQSSMARSTVQGWMKMGGTLSTAMTHHKSSGPLYHHFLSKALVWVN